MDENSTPAIPILAASWRRYAELVMAARDKDKLWYTLRFWAVAFSVAAVLLAIVTDHYSTTVPDQVGWALKVLLILVPFLSALLAASISRRSTLGDWLLMRRAAEILLSGIYFYRTILVKSSIRDEWLEDCLKSVTGQVFKDIGHEISLSPYQGSLPPFRDPRKDDLDPGFKDLTGDEYVQFRLEPKLAGLIQAITNTENARLRFQGAILFFGCAGLLLAAIGGSLSIWVALTASLVLAFVAGGDHSSQAAELKQSNWMIVELNALRDHWLGLQPAEKTEQEFHHLVHSTEEFFLRQGTIVKPSTVKESGDIIVRSSEPIQPTQEGSSPDRTAANPSLSETIQKVALDFSDLNLTKETPKELLHQVLAQFPPSGEIKG